MRSPIVAMLWENWRLTRIEAAVRFALVMVAGAAMLLLSDKGATYAFWMLTFLHGMVWLSIAKLNGGRFMDGYKPGFPFYLLYARPVSTALFVGVAMAYDAITCLAMYLVSAALLGLAFGQPLPLFSVATWIVVCHLCYACIQWSTTNRVGQYVGSFACLLPLFLLLRNRLTPSLHVEFSLGDHALMVVLGIVAFGLTVAGVARQRSGGAVVSVAKKSISGVYPDWLVSLFRFPCPTSSATRAQIWFELKTSGLPMLAIGLTLAVLIPLLFAISIPVEPARVAACSVAVFVIPVLLTLGVNAFGIRRKQGRAYASTFETTQPYGTTQLATLKVLVRTSCMLAVLAAVGVSLWTSISLVSAWGSWTNLGVTINGAPGLTGPRDAIAQAVGGLAGYADVALALVVAIAIAFLVASFAAFNALRARYSRHLIIVGSLLLVFVLAHVLLSLAWQRGIVSTSELDAIWAVTKWIPAAAMMIATVYLFWNSLSGRVLTGRYAFVVVAISAAFGAAWVTLLLGAGVQIAGITAADTLGLLSLLLPLLMAGVLAPWSLHRMRHQ